MKIDIVQPVRLSVKILKLFGLWSLNSEHNSLLYRIYTYFLHFNTTFSVTVLMLASVLKAENIEQFTEPLFVGLTMLALLIKVINILNLNSVAVNFIKQLEGKEFHLLNDSEELKIFKNSLRVFYVVAILYTGASYAVVVFGFSTIAFGQKWVLPYPTWLPFEYRYESKFYWTAYFYQFVGLSVACLSNVSIDMLQCYLMRSISLIYFVIGSRLAKIGNDFENVSDSFEVNKMFLEELKEIIKVHDFAKKLTVDSERLLSLPIFIQVLLSAFVLCFTGYRLSSMSIWDSPGRFIEVLDFLFVMGLQIYLPCHYGNEVTLEAGKLSEALYSSNWTVMPLKSKKIIYLYMEFLKEPIYLKAGSFFQIGIPTFAKTINNAYSFFAVLIRMKK